MIGNIVVMRQFGMVAVPWTPMAVTLRTLGCEYFDEKEPFWNTYTPELLKKYSKSLKRDVTVRVAMELGLQPQTVFFFKDTEETMRLIAAYSSARETPIGQRKHTDIPNEAYAEMAGYLFPNRNQIMADISGVNVKLKQQMPDGSWKVLGVDCSPEVKKHFGLK